MPATVTVLDSAGATQTVNTLPALGQGLMAASLPVVIASNQGAVTISGTVTANAGSGTQAVSLASLPALAAGSALVGKVGLDQTTPGTTNAVSIAYIGSTAVAAGAGAVSAGVIRVTQASDSPLVAVSGTTSDSAVTNGSSGTIAGYLRSIKDAATDTTTPSPVSAPTLTKGTQAANGFSVQELKDAGRSTLCMTAEFTFAQTAETLLTMTLSADGATTSTFSSRVITSGKKFRIQSVDFEIESLGSGTAPQRAYLRLRRNTAGATTSSSALQTVWSCVNNTAVVKSGAVMHADFPDGIEMNGDGTATFGFTLETPDWVTTTATGRAKITVIGVEF